MIHVSSLLINDEHSHKPLMTKLIAMTDDKIFFIVKNFNNKF